jgi:hypothetical protein
MADKTMPPNDPNPAPDTGMGAAPADKMAPDSGMPSDSGSVMISMPEEAFNAIRDLINQLSQGVDNLAQSVGQQKAGSEAPAPEMPPAGMDGGAAGGSPADEDFLKGIAEAGSQR